MGAFGFEPIESTPPQFTYLMIEGIGRVALAISGYNGLYTIKASCSDPVRFDLSFRMQGNSREDIYLFTPMDNKKLHNYYPAIHRKQKELSSIILTMFRKNMPVVNEYGDIRTGEEYGDVQYQDDYGC